MNIYSIFDAKALVFSNPFFLPSDGLAIRSFTSEVNRKDDNNALHTYSEDFTLYNLGSFDPDTGAFETQKPVVVITASQVIVP